MKIKKLFHLKPYINLLAENKIDLETLIYLIFSVLLFGMFNIVRMNLSLITESFQDFTGMDQITTALTIFPLTFLFMFFTVIFHVIIGSLIYIIIFIVLNFVLQKIFHLFKKKITFWKLINLTIYVLFINKFIILILITIMTLFGFDFTSFAMDGSPVLPALLNYIINIGSLVLYILGVVWTIKNTNQAIGIINTSDQSITNSENIN
jgi:hypothetical protein